MRSHGFRAPSVLVATLALMVSAEVHAQPRHATPAPFMTVEWGMSPDTLVLRAAASGWSFSHIDDDGDYTFRGAVDANPAVAYATFSQTGGLTRVMLSVMPNRSAPATYRGILDTLAGQHGRAFINAVDESGEVRPAPGMAAAAAWPGILMGLRRDGWIMLIFTCPGGVAQAARVTHRTDRLREVREPCSPSSLRNRSRS